MKKKSLIVKLSFLSTLCYVQYKKILDNLKMGDTINFQSIEDDLRLFKMEDDINF